MNKIAKSDEFVIAVESVNNNENMYENIMVFCYDIVPPDENGSNNSNYNGIEESQNDESTLSNNKYNATNKRKYDTLGDCNESSSSDEEIRPKRKRAKRSKVDCKKWSQNKNKSNRERGESYLGRKQISGKWTYDIPKHGAVMGERCNCIASKKTMKCAQFTDEDRQNIYKQFAAETWMGKHTFVNAHVGGVPVKRSRDRKNEESRRIRQCIF